MTTTATPPASDAAPSTTRMSHPVVGARAPRGHIGAIVAGSFAGGLLAAVALVAAPFIPPTEAGLTGAVLCGIALGWALLAVLSTRFTDQPQRWAAAPALVMGLSGLLLIAFGHSALELLSWVWPPVMLALAVWMLVSARRHLHSPSRRWLVYPALGVLALASLGGGYQTVRAAVEASADAMPGQLVDVGGHRLHLTCTGSGSPTVVLEPGAGMVSAQLGLITPTVARDTRVCVYDRAGRGWSEPAATRQDATQIATDLHTLLERAQVPGPYVLAGHSFGGLYVMTFAARYPADVAGLVLVDSTPPASPADATATAPDDAGASPLADRVVTLVSASARLGVTRLAGLPTPNDVRSTIEEYGQGGSSTREAAALRDFAGNPLIVLTAGIGHDADASAAQDALATLSTGSVHRVIDDVDHMGMIVDEDGAAATARAILDVVTSIRTATPMVD
ncbi:alpha/beta hydrolase [Cellulomonas sp. ICMP 17802]|uniref:alpha/beta hydrolase n=1 Tax=Cellulomonas sp. ICMP 17802 TaxID=3239199 RepID=UPI00351B85F6